MVSIIIPVYNQEKYTNACIESIKANTEDYEITIVDNGSSPSISEALHIIPNIDFPLIRNEENLGFPKAVNQGIEVAKGDIIVIINNDTIVTPHWLEILQGHLSNGLDIVGACTNSSSGPQQVLIDQYNDLETLYEAAESNRKKNEGQSFPYHRIVFICVAIKREVIDKIGLLDEIYTPGNFEDDDYCMRAIEAGFKIGIAKDCYVHHFGSITHKAMDINYRELLAKNQKIFNDHWGERYKELMRKNNG
jgi:GT2 family glycosyltransferase